ncbi:MAG: hypothetical protein CL489_10220 [Acidobacteria bacterium]|nr:hypothetical protein [Acidobacteriota bacterium]|tara:strand:+ start:3661 stop:3876 length:216 start_codon:yes stop_codon:yes gene_type:complete
MSRMVTLDGYVSIGLVGCKKKIEYEVDLDWIFDEDYNPTVQEIEEACEEGFWEAAMEEIEVWFKVEGYEEP